MSWGAVLGGLAGGAMSLLGGDGGADKAAKAMAAAQKRMEARQRAAIEDVEGSVDDYFARLDTIDKQFDPYNTERAYASFYQGIILPMETKFKEYVLPSIHAAYSGGVFGPESYQSGAAKEAELRAKQELKLTEGTLLAQERQSAISQNFQINDRKKEDAASRLSASTIAPKLELGVSGDAFNAEKTAIESRFAADSAKKEQLLGLPSAIISGASAGSSIQDGINRVFGKGSGK